MYWILRITWKDNLVEEGVHTWAKGTGRTCINGNKLPFKYSRNFSKSFTNGQYGEEI